jgi:hypothetical protein
MARKAPIPNIDEVLKTNPDIARQLATAAMQQQTQNMRAAAQPAAPVMPPPSAPSNPLGGLANFMSGMIPPPPPQQTNVRQAAPKSAMKQPTPIIQPRINIQPPAPAPQPAKPMAPPSVNIDELLKSVNTNVETKKVTTVSTPKKGGSTGKNSVTIKL